MKKLRFFTPVMATIAALTPATAILSSCGKIDYTDKIAEFKDNVISTFIDMAKTCHRTVWDEGEGFEYIQKYMTKLGIEPSGFDHWSEIPQVQQQIVNNLKHGRPTPEDKKAFKDWGNIWYDIPATSGMEDAPKLIITSHTDSSIAFGGEKAVEDWVKATENIIDVHYDRDNDILETNGTNTSLGADGGLGIAMLLSIAKNRNKFRHGQIRLLFTAGESESVEAVTDPKEGFEKSFEFGSGSALLFNDQVAGGKLISDEGEIGSVSYLEKNSTKPFGEKDEYPYIISTGGIYKNCIYNSAAGIHDCEFADYNLHLDQAGTNIAEEDKNLITWTDDLNLFTLSVDGLNGGHSAKNINQGYANALQLLAQMLFTSDNAFRIIGGFSKPGPRSIPSRGQITFATKVTKEDLEYKCKVFIESFKNGYPNDTWDKFKWTLTSHDVQEKDSYKYSLSPRQSRELMKLFAYELDYGPVDWFDKERTKVRTSCNFADFNLEVDQKGQPSSVIHFHNVCRSADEDMLNFFHYIASTVLYDSCQMLYKYHYPEGSSPRLEAEKHSTHIGKVAWEKTENDKVINFLTKGFENMGIKPIQWENHGWIDAAVFPEIYKNAFGNTVNITCLGPEVRNSNDVNETVWLDTMSTAIGAMLYVMENIKNI